MKRLIVTIVVCWIGLCGMAAPLAAAGNAEVFSLRGQRRSAVILRAEESTDHAATLAKYLKEIVGHDLAVIADPAKAPAGALKIHVGRDAYVRSLKLDFDALHPYGYYLKLADGDNMVIAGKYRGGTDYAVFDFLKRYGGYRSFMPGDLGEVVPHHPVVTLPSDLNLRENPSFITLASGGGGVGGFTRAWRLTLQATHNLDEIYPPSKYMATHPEYYGMMDGKREKAGPDEAWQPCVSNPDLPAIAVDYARTFFKNQRSALGLSVGINDGGGDCQCPNCMAWRKEYGNQYLVFANAVARLFQKDFPDKYVGFLAYGQAGPVPHNIKVGPNIYVEVMEGQARNGERLRLWHEAGAKLTGIYGWDYASGESGFVLPRYYPHYVGNAWKKAYREDGLRGGWFEIGGRTSLYEGPRFYVLNELAWNINANIDALLDDYFSSFYAEAAVPMHEFYDRIEAIYGRMADPTDPRADCIWGGADFTAQYQEYTRADLTYLDNKLSEATRLAKDANAARRVALFRELWGLGELHVAAYLDARDLQATQTIGDEAQIKKTIGTIRHSLTALDGIANYQISDNDQRLIFYKPGKDAMACFRQGAPIDVIVQREGDRNLDLATECLRREAKGDKQTIGAFWRKAAAQETDARLKALLLTQVYTAEAPAAPTQNLMPGPGQAPGAVQYSDADLARFDWHPAPGNLPGWYFYKYPPFRASLSWDRTETHSGKGSFAIGEDQMYACFIYGLPVTPGCRYRISFWVKENPQPVAKGEGLVIHWQNAQKVWTEAPDAKWLPDVGVENPGFKVPYPLGGLSEWRHVQATFSVPSGVSTAVLIFGARQQKPGESTWIDDVSVAKAFDPSFFAGGEK